MLVLFYRSVKGTRVRIEGSGEGDWLERETCRCVENGKVRGRIGEEGVHSGSGRKAARRLRASGVVNQNL